jgi:hypothetical protein
MKFFLRFAFVSGVGWLLDLVVYMASTQIFGVAPPFSNFVSSVFGVTYVWIISLNRLFHLQEYGQSIYLLIYWGCQVASIFVYSLLISKIAASAINSKISEIFGMPFEIVAKIIVTTPNLLTNFIFITILTQFMKPLVNLRNRL